MKVSRSGSLVIGFAGTILLALLMLLVPGLTESWEAKTFDLRSQWHRATPDSGRLLLIGRDAESDARFGVGIWDRAVFATMISGLHRAGAQVVGLDFHFGEESPAERGGAGSDRALVEAATRAGNVLFPLPVNLSDHAGEAPTVPLPLRNGMARSLPSFEPAVLHALPTTNHIAGPLPGLLQVARGVGHIGAISDADGVYRRVPSFVNAGGQAIPSLGVALAAAYLHIPPDRMTLSPGRSLTFQEATFSDGTKRNLSIPVDDQGDILINYAGRWTEGPFPYLSFVDVWDAIQEGRDAELREQVAGKAILIVHAALGSDKRQTPLELTAPGGFILANIFNTILTESALWTVPVWLHWVLIMGIGAGAAWCLLAFSLWGGLVAVALIGAVYLLVSFAGFASSGLVLPVVLPFMALALATGSTLAWTRWLGARHICQLEDERVEYYRRLADTQRTLVERETRAEQLEEDLNQVQADARVGRTESAELQALVATLQRDLQTAQAQASQARDAVNDLQSRLDKMQTAQANRSPLLEGELDALRQDCAQFGILTRDAVLLRTWKDLKKVAKSHVPILILGEPGTGKELFAQAGHRLSERASYAFVPVNMAAVPADLFESELFGHLRGSFTGAVRDHEGYFQQADKGTIFLDEIGDLRSDLQAKLLRVLQDGMVMRVGDKKTIKVDVRVVSATNRNLLQGIAEGWFREDLYYRLHGIELRLPPLRERQTDVPALAQAFIDQFVAKAGRGSVALSQGAADRLQSWPWKGNVRELKRCVENAVMLAEGATIQVEDLRLAGAVAATTTSTVPVTDASEGEGDPKKSDPALLKTIREHSFDLQATATTLGWDRSTVMQRLKGMCFQALVQTKGDQRAAAASLAGEPGLTRLVEVKLKEYVEHLGKVVATYPSTEAALTGCRKRFKNLPERYQEALATLVRLNMEGGG